jgi:diguanylate cyclase (GGDEF)-like protein
VSTQDRGQVDGELSTPNGAVANAAGPDASIGLGLITRDLARALGAGVALLARTGDNRRDVEILAAWGLAASHDGLPLRLEADGLVGRALGVGRTTVEPLGLPDAQSLGVPDREASRSDVLIAPVRPPSGPAAVLCAVFSADRPQDPETTVWLAESYARLAALCLYDRQALDGLLDGGRTDGLTGCLTQAAVVHELHRELARSDRHERPVSCGFIDLDRFKRVNDRYGHLHGSRVLANVAAILSAGIRSEDTLGRYGGDEFVVLLPDTDEQAAVELSERLRATIARTTINLPHDPIDASIGVAQWRPGSPAPTMLAAADKALLAAKASGGGIVISASSLTLADSE